MFFWNSLAFSMIQQMWAIWSLAPLPFINPACISGSSQFTYCWSLAWRILSMTLLVNVVALQSLSHVWFFVNPWTAACQASLSFIFSQSVFLWFNICWIIEKAREFEKNIYFCFIDYAKAFDCVDLNKLENSEKDGNIRPHVLPLEKSGWRSGSHS